MHENISRENKFMRIHKGLTPEGWFKFTFFEQMANVGSEVERAIDWKDKELQLCC